MIKSYKIAILGVFTALAITFGWLESIIPMPVSVLGVKLGIANVVILLVIYVMGGRFALCINIARITASGLLFGGPSGIIYSMAGGLLSFMAMYAGKRSKLFSVVGVSILGGIFHNIGQILVSVFIVSNIKLVSYLPVLLISGVLTGFSTGLICLFSLPSIKKYYSKKCG